MAAVEKGPTQVQEVLAKGPIADPYPTLDEARSDPARLEKIRQVRRLIDEKGIKYIFFQQVSVSGHVNGKGVVGDDVGRVAEDGYQLVYGATADLFVDQNDRYIGFGPEESELAAIADLDTFKQLPWDRRVARVFCDCYDTETGGLLESDPRQNLKRIMNEVEQELGYTFLCGIEPEMMWLKKTDDPNKAEGLTKPWCYHINQFEELREIILDVVDYGEQLGIHPTYGDHEDSPGQLELNFLFDRAIRTADNLSTYRQICAAVARKHDVVATFMPKPFTGVSANGAHHHFTLVDEAGHERLLRPVRPGEALRDRPAVHGRHPRPLSRPLRDHGADGQLVQALLGLRLLGADLQGLRLAEPHLPRARRERRPLRVPRRRLGVQPVPHAGRAAEGRPRRRQAQARPRPAAAAQRLRRARRGQRRPARARPSRRGARGARAGRGRPQRAARAASTTSTCTTSGTSGSASSARSPTGSASATSTCCPDMCGIAGIIYEGRPARDRPRHDADAPVDEAPRPRLDRLRALRAARRTST